MKPWKDAALLAIFTLFPPLCSARPYGMADLEVLEAEKNYLEFFQHAKDILPTKRNQHWKDMVNNMAESFSKDLIQKKDISWDSYRLVSQLQEWPLLKENEFFLSNYGKLGLLFFQKCPSRPGLSKEICLREIYRFWRSNPQDPFLGVELGELAKFYGQNRPAEQWIFYQKAVNHDLSQFLCQKPAVSEALYQHLSSLLVKLDKQPQELLKILNLTVAPECWKVFKGKLEAALYQSSGPIQTVAYRLLKLKKEVGERPKDFYLTLFLLQGPVEGDIFNESWNNLRDLGKNHERRMEVFKALQTLDPLPGKVFGSFNKDKKKVILDFLSQHFPEYMDFYARTCLDYMSGKKTFENGNPTLNCKDLIQAAKNTTWVDAQLQKSFQELPKF